MRNAELTRKRDKPKSQLTALEMAGEWQDLRDELAQAIMVARRYSRLYDICLNRIQEKKNA